MSNRPSKPLTTVEASIALGAALARLGAAMLESVGANVTASHAYLWAVGQEIDAFKMWCLASDVDPQPSLERMKASTLPVDEFLARERAHISAERNR